MSEVAVAQIKMGPVWAGSRSVEKASKPVRIQPESEESGGSVLNLDEPMRPLFDRYHSLTRSREGC